MRPAAAALLLALCFAPGALHAQAGGPPPAAAAAPFTFTVPQSRILVKVSDPGLQPDVASAAKPNYFKLSRPAPLLIISGWLEPAARYKGLEALWEEATKSPVMSGPLAPTRVEMLREGKWEVVAFDVALPGGIGTQSNLRAEYVEAGTWIDLHISTASARPPATMRTELVAVLRRVQVVQK